MYSPLKMEIQSLMAAPALLMHIIVWFAASAHGRIALPRVNFTIPVNPVREGSVLSVHCKIYNLEDNSYKVRMSRQLGDHAEVLSLDGNHLHQNEHIFTAVREFSDGSTVYFVTIVHASREDQGTYFCSVISHIDYSVLDRKSAFVKVEYFPSENYPQCQPFGEQETQNIREGNKLSFNCTTEQGQPPVSITWQRNGDKDSLKKTDLVSENTSPNGLVTSTLTSAASMEDDGAVFFCSISSSVYDDHMRSCHIGPVSVRPNPNLYRVEPIIYKTSPNPMTSSDFTFSLNDNGLHNNVKFHTWAIVVAATICIIVLTIGLTFVIVFYGLGYSKRGRVVDHTPQIRHQRRNDIRVEFRRSAEQNIYVAV